MKKTYTTPACELVKLHLEGQIMINSEQKIKGEEEKIDDANDIASNRRSSIWGWMEDGE